MKVREARQISVPLFERLKRWLVSLDASYDQFENDLRDI
jgi:hypothetical protein